MSAVIPAAKMEIPAKGATLMKRRFVLILTVVAAFIVIMPRSAGADTLLTPFAGITFGGDAWNGQPFSEAQSPSWAAESWEAKSITRITRTFRYRERIQLPDRQSHPDVHGRISLLGRRSVW